MEVLPHGNATLDTEGKKYMKLVAIVTKFGLSNVQSLWSTNLMTNYLKTSRGTALI